jgi:HAMP domain-containing protein
MEQNTASKRPFYASLVFKISLFVASLLFLSMIIISIAFVLSERIKISADIVKNGEVFASSTNEKIYLDYAQYYTHPGAEQFNQFKENVQTTLKNNQDVVGVSMVATTGRILFDSGEFTTGKATKERNIDDTELLQMVKKDAATTRTITLKDDTEVTEIIVPLPESGGGHILSMRYLVSNRSLYERMNEIYKQIAIVVIPLMIFVILLVVPFTLSFARPIHRLTRAVEKVREGNFDIQTEVKSNDEIGTLATAFNQMSNKLKDYYASLLSRTTELEELKNNLEKTVEQRTSELNQKINELEQMNKLMVGRELKMIELKKELDDLKQKMPQV